MDRLGKGREPGQSISPVEFIPVAEESGLIKQIGAWVLRQACLDAMMWSGQASIAVNISAVQFMGSGLVADVKDAL
ncbi:MAG: EAL domain-containing protein, partial [Methyloligellaceae bacterium]